MLSSVPPNHCGTLDQSLKPLGLFSYLRNGEKDVSYTIVMKLGNVYKAVKILPNYMLANKVYYS